jgi:hypothetical protein
LPKFPTPPASDALAEIEPAIRRLRAGTRVWRVYFRGGPHPTRWNQMRTFGPTTARFDHHLPDPRGGPMEQTRAIQYLALDGIAPVAKVKTASTLPCAPILLECRIAAMLRLRDRDQLIRTGTTSLRCGRPSDRAAS